MCIKMRKIIFRLDMTFLEHKSTEITSRRECYFFAQIQEITIFPSMFIFWYLIFPSSPPSQPSPPPALWDVFSFHPSYYQQLIWPPNAGRNSVWLLWRDADVFSVRGGLKSSLVRLSLCLVLRQGPQVLFELSAPDLILYILSGDADSGCQWIRGKYWTGKPFWLTWRIII